MESQTRYFKPFLENDAVTRFADRVAQFDRDPSVSAAWVCLERLPDSIFPKGAQLVSWTKTSDERPTAEGELAEP